MGSGLWAALGLQEAHDGGGSSWSAVKLAGCHKEGCEGPARVAGCPALDLHMQNDDVRLCAKADPILKVHELPSAC